MPKWLRAKGTKRNVEDDEMGWAEFHTFMNLAFYAALRKKSELLQEESKRDFVKAEAITKSMVVSSLWISLPMAMMSPGLDLSLLK